MELVHLIILGLVQGLTEFLPISSSAHLILIPELLGWQDQGISYDIAVHAGSLGALVLYFRVQILALLKGGLTTISGNSTRQEDFLLWYLLLATMPVGLAGLLLHDLVADGLRDPVLIATTSIAFGLLLLWADRYGSRSRDQSGIGWRDALLIGLAQALALIPGTSRSGITMTAGLMLGLDRQSTSRFSFLLAIPVIILASSYQIFLLSRVSADVDWGALLSVSVAAFASALLAIHYFLKLLDRSGMLPYVIYRVVLGFVLLAIYL